MHKEKTHGDSRINFVFFGTGNIAVGTLSELERAARLPALIVTTPDKPQGRKLKLTPSPIKAWASSQDIEVRQPEKFDASFIAMLESQKWDVFVVVDYGKILPTKLIDVPRHGTVNMHPSLLPRLRGPSPIRSAILTDERKIGVTIMRVNEKLDEGPIIAQRTVTIPDWPPRGRELDGLLSHAGGKLLADILPHWVRGDIEAHAQNHDVATYSSMFKKEDGLLDLNNGDAYQNLLKIRAFDEWPGTFAFFEKKGIKIRVQIIDGHIENEGLAIDIVKPEGKREMPYGEFVKSGARPIS